MIETIGGSSRGSSPHRRLPWCRAAMMAAALVFGLSPVKLSAQTQDFEVYPLETPEEKVTCSSEYETDLIKFTSLGGTLESLCPGQWADPFKVIDLEWGSYVSAPFCILEPRTGCVRPPIGWSNSCECTNELALYRYETYKFNCKLRGALAGLFWGLETSSECSLPKRVIFPVDDNRCNSLHPPKLIDCARFKNIPGRVDD